MRELLEILLNMYKVPGAGAGGVIFTGFFDLYCIYMYMYVELHGVHYILCSEH